jgi:integrase
VCECEPGKALSGEGSAVQPESETSKSERKEGKEMRSNRNPVYERTPGVFYIRYADSRHRLRREAVTWKKIRDAQIKVGPSSKLQQPGRDLAARLLDVRRAAADRNEKMLAIRGQITYKQLRDGLLANYREKGNRTIYKTKDGNETIGGLKELDRFFGLSATFSGPLATDITTDTGREFARKQLAAGYSAATINRSLACLRRMLKIALEDETIKSMPKIRLYREPNARTGFVTHEQFDKLLAALPARLRPLVQFLYSSGCRLGEACLIQWHQVSLKDRLIRLEAGQTKNGTARVIPLSRAVIQTLTPMEAKTGTVFDAGNLRGEWAKACTSVGLGKMEDQESASGNSWKKYEGLIVHDLRRSAIRNLVRAGNPEKTVMSISGHKTRSTFDRYCITSTADVTAAMDRADAFRLRLASTDTTSGTNLPPTKQVEVESVTVQ